MAEQPAPAGVIHDLGYRHYDGPRLGPSAVARALALDGLRGAYGLGRSTRSKVMPVLLSVVTLLPAVFVAVLTASTGGGDDGIAYVSYPLVLSLVTSLFVAGQAPAGVSRDLRFRVVSLYFSRPLSRTDYVRAKYAGLAAALLLLQTAPLLVLYVGALLGGRDVWGETRGLLEGLLLVVLLSLLLAGIGLLVAALTPRRGLGVAAVVAVLVVLAAVQGVLQTLGEQQDSPALVQYSRLASPFTLAEGVTSLLFGAPPDAGLPDPTAGPGLACLAGVVVVAVGCVLLLQRRYRTVSVS